ncbi:MAG: methionyl-tRNA formyltransferase [Bacteroidia bacterium]|nr:methionyl-tRNA formyltransferase [Bacteroidia bacterium]
MARIIFMGTPQFAVPSLEALLAAGHEVVAVVTPPDKPAGRGRKLQPCPVKITAMAHGLTVLQPEKLKDPGFILTLEQLEPEIIVVVAFRMLPEEIWTLPAQGTFNLHSSYLPNYRGAAPMNHAIINGETETGITTFLLDKTIDTGKILLQEKVRIPSEMNVGQLHDLLMNKGAALVLKTIEAIENKTLTPMDQRRCADSHNLKTAPKFTKEDLRINWHLAAQKIHNFIRGLSPYPAAFTTLCAPDGDEFQIKIFTASVKPGKENCPGTLLTNCKNTLEVATGNGIIAIEELQIQGKKRMSVDDFLRGFTLTNDWKMK